MGDKLARTKINLIRKQYIAGKVCLVRLAAELKVKPDTVRRYINDFREIERLYPRKLKDFNFMIPVKFVYKTNDYRFEEMIKALPDLIENSKTLSLDSVHLWQDYRKLYPQGYCHDRFALHYRKWKKENKLCTYFHRRIKTISPDDMSELEHWRNSENIELWRKAVAILDSFRGRRVDDISAQIERSRESILVWIKRYQEQGLESLKHKTFTPNARVVSETKLKQENLIKLLQQSPKLHGLNRASWSLADLSRVYEKVYGKSLSTHAISDHFHKMGYRFQKSRERLTSPDKDFRPKMDKIKGILAHLKPDEKFFSIDEYGPKSVKMRTGWSLTKDGEVKVVSQMQKSKGWYIMTAALELSANQVTHFYSEKKDSSEIVKLIDLLVGQYKSDKTLYLSWDCASWHFAKNITKHVHYLNSRTYRKLNRTPRVELAPLPSSAQYLNVIESVFSGMAKSIIHNSDYASLKECKDAIDRYFTERNFYFQENPKRAGKKIWGQEIVKSVFNETNNCKEKKKIPNAVKLRLPKTEDT